jgi:hypothetical protein
MNVTKTVPSKGHKDEFHFKTDLRKATIRRRQTLKDIDDFAAGAVAWTNIQDEKPDKRCTTQFTTNKLNNFR